MSLFKRIKRKYWDTHLSFIPKKEVFIDVEEEDKNTENNLIKNDMDKINSYEESELNRNIQGIELIYNF